ncbi:UNVERIFIED_CONTAM: choline dehydrogenase-like flavoprotein [Williamsia faeni]
MAQIDYIIVGAGSAGCVLADRLSADGTNHVVLLEAGGSDRNPLIAMPMGSGFLLENPRYTWQYDVEPFGPLHQNERWARGKVLGGSSSINGMIYNRGSQADYDHLVACGNPGWGWDEMLPIFKAIEDHSLGASEMRGAGGPLAVSVTETREAVSEALLDSTATLGVTRVDDVNSSDTERVGYAPATIRKGVRVSAAKAFLRPALVRPNLEVRTETTVTKVLFDGDRAAGVSTSSKSGEEELHAAREVILSAGSLQTPQILQLSGIGPRDVLSGAGVDVRVDSPRVGEGLREHRCFPLQMRLRENKGYNKMLSTPMRQAVTGARYLVTHKGLIAKPMYDILAFLRADPMAERPDAQLLMSAFSAGVGMVKPGAEARPGLSMIGFPLRPTSEGSVRICSSDPSIPPRVEANYLDTEHDRRVSVAVFRRMREIVEQSPIAKWLHSEIEPGRAVEDDDSVLRAGLLYGGTGFHASGACAMGPDDVDVLGCRLRVRGVTGLRVVDVSILPAMVAGNLNGPIMAMAWRAAEMILVDR